MTDDDFLQQLLADPTDDTLRLVYADWLEEHANKRANFLRLLVEQRKAAPGQNSYPQRQSELNRLRRGLPPEWLAAVDEVVSVAALRQIIAGEATGRLPPYSTGADEEIEPYLHRIVAGLNQSRLVSAEPDFNHYGSGYASFVPVFCPKANRRSTTRQDDSDIIDGIAVWLCRLAPVAAWGKQRQTRSATGGSFDLPEVKSVGTVPPGDWSAVLEEIEWRLNQFGLNLPTSDEFRRPLPFQANIPTILSDPPYTVFDAFFYWAD